MTDYSPTDHGNAPALEEARAYLARQASHDPHPKAFIRETRKHALELLLHHSTTPPTPQRDLQPHPHKHAVSDHTLARILTQATDTTTFNRITNTP